MKKILTLICGLLLSITPGILKAQVIIVQPVAPPTMDQRLKEMGNRYDDNYAVLSAQYNELMDVYLANKVNRTILKSYQDDVKKWTKDNLGKMNLGDERTVASISNYLNQWKNNPDLVYEYKLENGMMTEVDNIKQRDPNNFESSVRYVHLKEAIHAIANCNPNEIAGLADKYNL